MGSKYNKRLKLFSFIILYMFSFLRRAMRPIAMIGEKMGNVFKIGRKAEVIKDIRNVEKFENVMPLRMRKTPPSDLMTPDGAFYGNMESYLGGFKYPV